MGSIMNQLFGSGSKQPASPSAPTTPAATSTTTSGAPPVQSPTLEKATGTSDKPKNPLDDFSKIWDPKLGADGKPIPPADNRVFQIDPKAVSDHFSKQDFKKFVKPETLEKIGKGGQDAQAAFGEAIQDLSTNLSTMLSVASTQLIEKALAAQRSRFESDLPGLVKKLSLGENLRNKHPVLNHPATKPLVEALQSQFSKQFPDATTQELQTMAESYLTGFATELTKKSGGTEDNSTGGKGGKETDQDWSGFLPEELR